METVYKKYFPDLAAAEKAVGAVLKLNPSLSAEDLIKQALRSV